MGFAEFNSIWWHFINLMPFIIGIIVLIVVISMMKGNLVQIVGPTLILRKFLVNDVPSDGVIAEIIGRRSGFIAWLMTKFGIGSETSLVITEKEVTFKSSSLSGQIFQVVPLPSISITHCGYMKPIWSLMLGALITIVAVYMFLIMMVHGAGGFGALVIWLLIILVILLLGALFLEHYYYGKRILISFTAGGKSIGLCFQRGFMENVFLDMEQALKAMQKINVKVVESQMGYLRNTVGKMFCPKCGVENEENSEYCYKCGKPL